MNLVDAILLVLLMIGVLNGVRKGAIKTVVELLGSVVVLFLSWTLKGVLANVLIKVFPTIGSNPAISVIIYQVISFIVLYIIFTVLYKVVVGLSDVVERILEKTVILGFVSKVIGAVLGLFKAYIIMFSVLFILSSFNIKFLNESKVNNFILEKTPLLAPMASDLYETGKKVYESSNIEESIKLLFEKNIITEDNMRTILNKYNETKKNE